MQIMIYRDGVLLTARDKAATHLFFENRRQKVRLVNYKHFLRVKRDEIQLFKRVKTSKSTSLGLHKIAKS